MESIYFLEMEAYQPSKESQLHMTILVLQESTLDISDRDLQMID